jgi:hypothetical protein
MERGVLRRAAPSALVIASNDKASVAANAASDERVASAPASRRCTVRVLNPLAAARWSCDHPRLRRSDLRRARLTAIGMECSSCCSNARKGTTGTNPPPRREHVTRRSRVDSLRCHHCGLDPQSTTCADSPRAWIPDQVRDDNNSGVIAGSTRNPGRAPIHLGPGSRVKSGMTTIWRHCGLDPQSTTCADSAWAWIPGQARDDNLMAWIPGRARDDGEREAARRDLNAPPSRSPHPASRCAGKPSSRPGCAAALPACGPRSAR